MVGSEIRKKAMGVLPDSWCFCRGTEKSERMKASIFSTKASAIARISTTNLPQTICSTGFLIHRNLLLTSHSTLPTAASAVNSDVRLSDGITATLFPHRFFITSSVLDLTIVGFDSSCGEDGHGPGHHLRICPKPNLDLGNTVYFLGYTEVEEVGVGEGKVVVSTDSLVKLSTTDLAWSPGSAGFDAHGNLAFMICYPMKLATSSSYLSWKRCGNDTQFGIPAPVICNWLYRHWEGSLDDPKMPLIRLTSLLESSSAVEKSDQYCCSFRRMGLKSVTGQNVLRRQTWEDGFGGKAEQETPHAEELSDVSFCTETVTTRVACEPGEICVESPWKCEGMSQVGKFQMCERKSLSICFHDAEVGAPTGSVQRPPNENPSSLSLGELVEDRNGYSSERGTLYSADTAESRNYMSPREVLIRGTKADSRNRAGERPKGGASHKRNDYCSPTVSSIMKKRDSPEAVGMSTPWRSGLRRQHFAPRGVRFD